MREELALLGIKNQLLLARTLELGEVEGALALRRLDGVLENLFLQRKNTRLSAYYRWHTQSDGKVRSAHAGNDGKIFSWDNPPATGHPGEDYGCRCWAEPLILEEQRSQKVIGRGNNAATRWGWEEFFDHYENGNGRPVTLGEIGQLNEVIAHAEDIIFPKVEKQVFAKARTMGAGRFIDDFSNSYWFYWVDIAHGRSTVKGKMHGSVKEDLEFLLIDVTVDYSFYDEFTDIFYVREWTRGTSSLEDLSKEELQRGEFGVPYLITGNWKTKISAVIKKDMYKSLYE